MYLPQKVISVTKRPLYPKGKPTVKKLVAKQNRKYIAKVALKAVMRQAEGKYKDIRISTTAGSAQTNSWYQEDLGQIARGDSDSDRDGDKITPRSIQMRLRLLFADAYNVVRVMVLRCTDTVGGLSSTLPFSPGTIFQHNSTTEDALYSPFNHDYRSRFNVLYDRLFTLSTNRNDGLVNIVKRIKLSKKNIEYNGSNTADGRNRLILLVMSDSAAVSHPSVEGWVRLNYKDL